MKSARLLFAVVCVVLATSSLAQFDSMPSGTQQSICEAGCKNKDGDRLFPQGTNNRSCVLKCRGISGDAPPSPGVRPSGNNRAFILLEPMVYTVGNSGITVKVPAGFVTDYASIPERLWSLYSPHDQYSRAAVIHDYLYWTRKCKREQADNLFLIAMKESAVTEDMRQIVYAGVDSYGKDPWEKNKAERDTGMPRFVPIDRHDFPPNWSWEQYRAKLFAEGYRDPEIADQGAYCALGDSKAVPGATQAKDKVPLPVTVLRALKGIFTPEPDR
jgi:hypothetical protein